MAHQIGFPKAETLSYVALHKILHPTAILGFILLLGMVLRIHNLSTRSYWNDEMFTVTEGQQTIYQILTSGRLDQPPAYYLPFHLWVIIFGTAEMSTRLFSTLIGIGSIILIYLIGQELFGNDVGLMSAFLMSISSFQIYYSQMARYYNFFEFMALLSFLFFILALRSKQIIYFVLYIVTSILLVYSHAFGIFILAAQNLFFILQIKKNTNVMRIWIISQLLILFANFPNFYLIIFGGDRPGDVGWGWWLSTPPPLSLLRLVFHYILTARGERSWGVMAANYAAMGVWLMAGTWIYALRQGRLAWVAAARAWSANLQELPDVNGKLLMVSCWLLCPILLPYILSIVIVPVFADRYTISAAPALYLLMALGIFSIRKVVPIIISLGALVITVGPSLGHYYGTPVDEQWKEVAMYVEENSASDEVIVLASGLGIEMQQKTFDWYYSGISQNCLLSSEFTDPGAISKALRQCVTGHDRFWVIIPDYPSDPAIRRYRSFFLRSDQSDLHLIKEQQFVRISVYLFELTK